MWFFKRKNKNNEIDMSSTAHSAYVSSLKDKAFANYLSPVQVDKILENIKDFDFIDDEIKKEMQFPDLNYLIEKLMPSNLIPNKIRRNISPKDVLKATCLGDIIGSKYEFSVHDYNAVKTELLPPERASFTDDSVLSIASMLAILENPENPDFRQAYINGYKKYPSAGYGSAFVGWACNERMFYVENMENDKIDNSKGYHSFGDGCAMRIPFIAAYYENIEDVIKYTIKSVMTTHDHVESIKASLVLSIAIWMLLHNYSKDEVFEYCKEHYCCSSKELENNMYKWSYYHLDTDPSQLDNKESNASLFANYTVPYAIKCFYSTNSFDECMRLILSHFGDTDTTCAIAGTLCYACYGETGYNTDEILSKQNILKYFE